LCSHIKMLMSLPGSCRCGRNPAELRQLCYGRCNTGLTGIWAQSPQWGSGAKHLMGVRVKAPLKLDIVCDPKAQFIRKNARFCYFQQRLYAELMEANNQLVSLFRVHCHVTNVSRQSAQTSGSKNDVILCNVIAVQC
jgi:hypothetical protein